MARPPRGLLDQIEQGALDSKTPLTDVLRRCVALGGRSGSEQLRDWARRELDGYGDGEQELPAYRRVPAVIAIDGADLAKQVTGQQISSWQLPEFARDTIKQEAPLPHRVAELERLAAGPDDMIRLQHPGMADLVHYMNSQQVDYGTGIHSMYWKVSTTSIHGVLDAIRTTLVSLVAEMRATGGHDIPTAEVANQAVNVVLNKAKRSTINVNTNQAAGPSLKASQAIVRNKPPPTPSKLPAWIRGPWTFVVGAAGIAAAIAGVATWGGWNPFG